MTEEGTSADDEPEDDGTAKLAPVESVPGAGRVALGELWRPPFEDAEPAPTLHDLGIEAKKVEIERQRSDMNLGRSYARVLLGALAVQIAIADGAFYVYGFYNSWDIPVTAIEVWLAATVIEVIGVVAVITRSLFPTKSKGG
jgi:hypothetical protein